jgi:hypothetical protein
MKVFLELRCVHDPDACSTTVCWVLYKARWLNDQEQNVPIDSGMLECLWEDGQDVSTSILCRHAVKEFCAEVWGCEPGD